MMNMFFDDVNDGTGNYNQHIDNSNRTSKSNSTNGTNDKSIHNDRGERGFQRENAMIDQDCDSEEYDESSGESEEEEDHLEDMNRNGAERGSFFNDGEMGNGQNGVFEKNKEQSGENMLSSAVWGNIGSSALSTSEFFNRNIYRPFVSASSLSKQEEPTNLKKNEESSVTTTRTNEGVAWNINSDVNRDIPNGLIRMSEFTIADDEETEANNRVKRAIRDVEAHIKYNKELYVASLELFKKNPTQETCIKFFEMVLTIANSLGKKSIQTTLTANKISEKGWSESQKKIISRCCKNLNIVELATLMKLHPLFRINTMFKYKTSDTIRYHVSRVISTKLGKRGMGAFSEMSDETKFDFLSKHIRRLFFFMDKEDQKLLEKVYSKKKTIVLDDLEERNNSKNSSNMSQSTSTMDTLEKVISNANEVYNSFYDESSAEETEKVEKAPHRRKRRKISEETYVPEPHEEEEDDIEENQEQKKTSVRRVKRLRRRNRNLGKKSSKKKSNTKKVAYPKQNSTTDENGNKRVRREYVFDEAKNTIVWHTYVEDDTSDTSDTKKKGKNKALNISEDEFSPKESNGSRRVLRSSRKPTYNLRSQSKSKEDEHGSSSESNNGLLGDYEKETSYEDDITDLKIESEVKKKFHKKLNEKTVILNEDNKDENEYFHSLNDILEDIETEDENNSDSIRKEAKKVVRGDVNQKNEESDHTFSPHETNNDFIASFNRSPDLFASTQDYTHFGNKINNNGVFCENTSKTKSSLPNESVPIISSNKEVQIFQSDSESVSNGNTKKYNEYLKIEKMNTKKLIRTLKYSINGISQETVDVFMREEINGEAFLNMEKDDLKSELNLKFGQRTLLYNFQSFILGSK